MFSDDDIARLDVAVQHSAAVGVFDRVTHVDEPPQELAQLERAASGVFPQPSSEWNSSMASLRLSPRMNLMA